jgi:hypothetical protein
LPPSGSQRYRPIIISTLLESGFHVRSGWLALVIHPSAALNVSPESTHLLQMPRELPVSPVPVFGEVAE